MCREDSAPPSWRRVAVGGSSQTWRPLRSAPVQRFCSGLDVMPAAGGALFMQRLFALCVLIAGGVLFLTGAFDEVITRRSDTCGLHAAPLSQAAVAAAAIATVR